MLGQVLKGESLGTAGAGCHRLDTLLVAIPTASK